ncbi:MAG: four helix bundle protein [Candidatus Moranbacteria bacterium]|nr:four helix bundle protein [Candidatus Moranbacteria bacterium]
MQTKKIESFTDLIAWQKGHKIVLSVYSITKKFPKEEIFGLTNQMRRCAVSITSNIAEGFSRKNKKEQKQFYRISLGSLTELQSQLLVARDVKYLSNKEFKKIGENTIEVQKLIFGLIKSAVDA